MDFDDPGWRPDPTHHHLERWWDGQAWTDTVRDEVDGEVTTSDFDFAMATPVEGHDVPIPFWRRRGVHVALGVVGVVAAIAVAWGLTGPLPDLLDGLPASARSGAADPGGQLEAGLDIAEAAANGRWTIVAAYYPEPDAASDLRSRRAAALRVCVGDAVSGATLLEMTTSAERPPPALDIPLTPRVDQMADRTWLRLWLAHDGTRWVLQDPFEVTVGEAEPRSCTAD